MKNWLEEISILISIYANVIIDTISKTVIRLFDWSTANRPFVYRF